MSFKYKIKDLSLLSEIYGFKLMTPKNHYYDYYLNNGLSLAVTVTPKYFHSWWKLDDDEEMLRCYKLEFLGNSKDNKHLRYTLVETKNPQPTEESKRVDQNKLMNKIQKIITFYFATHGDSSRKEFKPSDSYHKNIVYMHKVPTWAKLNKTQ